MSLIEDVKNYLGDKYDESQEFMYNVYANIENLPDTIASKFNDAVNKTKDYLFYHKGTDENGNETGDIYLTDLDYYLNSESGWNSYNSDYMNLNIDYTKGVWGAPYQFLPSADMRTLNDGSGRTSVSEDYIDKFGIEYGERIVSRMPLLLITPGKPFFMTDFDEKTKKGILSSLASKASDTFINSVDELISGKKTGGRYYTLRFAYDEYYQYVNTECNTMAVLLGIQDYDMEEIGGTGKIGTYDWSNYTNEKLKGVFSSKEFVAFYLDSETSISDSFSNSTSESMLASAANQVSDVGREIGFLLGTEGSKIDSKLISAESLGDGLKGVTTALSGIPVVGNLISDISSKLVTVMSGGRLLFPEIWSDSSFTKSYSINIKLRTPEPDVLSWYINIGVPLCHLISLVLPMQTSGATNQGYKSPFLVRAFYKGLFNCDMGIITDMSITKGSECAWTLSGLPLEVDVSMTIKELYQAMSMTNNNGYNTTTIMDNDALLNYLMNTCGINIANPIMKRYADLYANAYDNKITDIPGNIFNSLSSGVSQFMYNLKSFNF